MYIESVWCGGVAYLNFSQVETKKLLYNGITEILVKFSQQLLMVRQI